MNNENLKYTSVIYVGLQFNLWFLCSHFSVVNRYGGWVLEAKKREYKKLAWVLKASASYGKACGTVQRLHQLVTGAWVSSAQINVHLKSISENRNCLQWREVGGNGVICMHLGSSCSHDLCSCVAPSHWLQGPGESWGHPQKNPWGIHAVFPLPSGLPAFKLPDSFTQH